MKKLIPILTLSLIAFGVLNAQEIPRIGEDSPTAPFSTNPEEEVISLPIYPACETIAGQDSIEIQRCFQNKIRTQIHDRLMMKAYELAELGMDRMTAVVIFVVNKEGRISNVQTESGNSTIYRRVVEEEMKQVAAHFPDVIPAKLANGDPVHYQYRVPVTFVFTD